MPKCAFITYSDAVAVDAEGVVLCPSFASTQTLQNRLKVN